MTGLPRSAALVILLPGLLVSCGPSASDSIAGTYRLNAEASHMSAPPPPVGGKTMEIELLKGGRAVFHPFEVTGACLTSGRELHIKFKPKQPFIELLQGPTKGSPTNETIMILRIQGTRLTWLCKPKNGRETNVVFEKQK